jgi:nicotinamide mononucleotide transporter
MIAALEWIATLSGLACVILTVRKSIWCWPVGLVSVLAFMAMFWAIRLYADAALQVFYVATGIYGWWAWLHAGPHGHRLPVGKLSLRGWCVASAFVAIGVSTAGWWLANHTDADFPYWDTLTTCLSLVAQVLLMRKIFETWVFWILVDVFSIGIYTAKGVYLTAGLYSVFLILAVTGFATWLPDRRNIP